MVYEEKKPTPFVNQTEGEGTEEKEKPETEEKSETSE